jgi:hypothetical protein
MDRRLLPLVALVLAAGCGRTRAARPVENVAPPVVDTTPCDPATPTLTIVSGPLRPGCTGGTYSIDGREMGTFGPDADANQPVPPLRLAAIAGQLLESGA